MSRPWSRAAGWIPRASSRSSASDWASSSLAEVDELLGVVRVLADPALDQRELQGEGHQPLLGAVVQVALDPAPLGVARGDDALAGRLQLGQPGLRLRVQLPVLQRDRGRRADGLDQLGVVVEGAVVDQRRDLLAVALHDRHRPVLAGLGQRDGRAVGVDVGAVRARVGDAQAGSPSALASAACSSAGAHRRQLAEQVGQPAPGQPRAQQPGEERDGHGDQRADRRSTAAPASARPPRDRRRAARRAAAGRPPRPTLGSIARRPRRRRRPPPQRDDRRGRRARRPGRRPAARCRRSRASPGSATTSSRLPSCSAEHQPQRGEHEQLEQRPRRPAPGPPPVRSRPPVR